MDTNSVICSPLLPRNTLLPSYFFLSTNLISKHPHDPKSFIIWSTKNYSWLQIKNETLSQSKIMRKFNIQLTLYRSFQRQSSQPITWHVLAKLKQIQLITKNDLKNYKHTDKQNLTKLKPRLVAHYHAFSQKVRRVYSIGPGTNSW